MSIQNVEAEQMVLGVLLLEGELINDSPLILLHFHKMIQTNSLPNTIQKQNTPLKKRSVPSISRSIRTFKLTIIKRSIETISLQ